MLALKGSGPVDLTGAYRTCVVQSDAAVVQHFRCERGNYDKEGCAHTIVVQSERVISHSVSQHLSQTKPCDW